MRWPWYRWSPGDERQKGRRASIGHAHSAIPILGTWRKRGEGRKERREDMGGKEEGREEGDGRRKEGSSLKRHITETQPTNQPVVYSGRSLSSLSPFSASVPSNQQCTSFQESPPPPHCQPHRPYTHVEVVVL